MTPEQIDNNYKYHTPDNVQAEKLDAIRHQAHAFAQVINAVCPESREKSVALTNLETAMFWANAAIARQK